MTNIFVVYRHDDVPFQTGMLVERLKKMMRPDLVFWDKDVLPDDNFTEISERRIAETKAIAVIIGPRWLTDQSGYRFLDNDLDFVRREIETAIKLGKRIVPILVDDARMPSRHELPPSLQQLGSAEAVVLRPDLINDDALLVITAALRTNDPYLFDPPPLARRLSAFLTTLFAPLLAFSSFFLIAQAGPRLTSPSVILVTDVFSELGTEIYHFLQRVIIPLNNPNFTQDLFLGATGLMVATTLFYLYPLWQKLLIGLFNRRVRDTYGSLGPGYGFVQNPLDESTLRAAVPPTLPPGSPFFERNALDSDSRIHIEDYRDNAKEWAYYLSKVIQSSPTFKDRAGKSFTTIGFIYESHHVQLGIIYYLTPLRALTTIIRRTLPTYIRIEDWRFPVIVRPWIPIEHAAYGTFGNCWVRCAAGRPSVLTARHAVKPKTLGKLVSIVVGRNPQKGRLVRSSAQMDAALVVVSENDWHGVTRTPPSSVIGYKPVRLLSGRGPTDGQIMEIQSSTIWAEAGREPLAGNYFFFSPPLESGDSGCLILDIEHKTPTPYLMYLGESGRLGYSYGYGVLLEQARRVWDLDFFT